MTRTPVFGYRPFTFCGGVFQHLLLTVISVASTVLQPRAMRCHIRGLGWCAFARHYLRNHFCFLFLRVLRCFSSPGSPHSLSGNAGLRHWVAPFGNPRLSGYLLLSAAYRSLSRPSSPPRAKASFMCPSLLSFFFMWKGAFISIFSPADFHILIRPCGPDGASDCYLLVDGFSRSLRPRWPSRRRIF